MPMRNFDRLRPLGGDEGSFSEKLLELNWLFISLVAAMALLGGLFLYGAAGGSWQPWAATHLWRAAVGFLLMLVVAFVNPDFWRTWAYLGYVACLLALMAVPHFGNEAFGAKRWLAIGGFSLQPSEFVKVSLVIVLARFYADMPEARIMSWHNVLRALLLASPAVFLVLRQPDLGMAILLLLVTAIVSFLAGTRMISLWVLGVLMVLASPFLWNHLLKGYQKQRILTFLNPEADPLKHGYQVLQSKIALGSGGFYGKGFLDGTQSHLHFLPENRTDFIFTMFAEETGFLGAMVLLGIYAALIIIATGFASQARSLFGRLVAQGLAALLFLYVVINVGMVTGLLPVVGLPLPLFSYGGSSLLSFMFAFGLLLSVWLHRRRRMGMLV